MRGPLRMEIGTNERMWRKRTYLTLLVLWAAFTFLLTSLPNVQMPVSFPYADKAAHLGFYGVMGLLCGLWRRACGEPVGKAILQAILFIAVAGGVDEIHQYWIPGRDTDLFDWTADLVGGGMGSAISAVLPRIFPILLNE